MARHAADFNTYEDYVELVARYRAKGLDNLRKAAELKRDRCYKEKRFRAKQEG